MHEETTSSAIHSRARSEHVLFSCVERIFPPVLRFLQLDIHSSTAVELEKATTYEDLT